MTSPGNDRRKRRIPRFLGQQLELRYEAAGGGLQVAPARLLDVTDGGWGIETAHPLAAGAFVTLSGESIRKDTGGQAVVQARVVWCQRKGSLYRIGLSREAPQARKPAPEATPSAELDYYEVLQLSPNADQETIQRVYRLLAQRFHPDNQDSGNQEMFRRILEAYQVLSDPAKRAAYDVDYSATRRLRWKIFDQGRSAQGVEAERRKRKGILELLYTKRAHQPAQPSMTLLDMEDLLGVAREHLEFSLWYLKESGLVTRADNGRYAITVKGVEEAEKDRPGLVADDHLLPEANVTAA